MSKKLLNLLSFKYVPGIVIMSMLFFAPAYSYAHSTGIAYRCDEEGAKFWVSTYHSVLEGPSPVGGLNVDGTLYNFESIVSDADFQANYMPTMNKYIKATNQPIHHWQETPYISLAPGTHIFRTSCTTPVECPNFGPIPMDIQCLACNETINFNEPVSTTGWGGGFDGQNNGYLLSVSGQYKAESFYLNMGGHLHVPGGPGTCCSTTGLYQEENHNISMFAGLSRLEGIRISRVDGDPFDLDSIDLYGEVSVGILTDFSNGSGSWTLFTDFTGTVTSPTTFPFGGLYTNLTEIYLADPFAAGGTWTSGINRSVWDTIKLSTCNEPPVASCKTATVYLDSNGEASITTADINDGSSDPDGDPLAFSLSVSSFDCNDTGANDVTLTISDGELSDSCTTTVDVIDKIAPVIGECVTFDIVPSDVPVTYTFTAIDNCDTDVDFAIDYTSIKSIGIDAESSDNQFTITDSGGVGNTITINITATDDTGNVSTSECVVNVLRPANEGVGNGVDADTPGHDNNGGNDDPGTGPGNPGAKGGKKNR